MQLSGLVAILNDDGSAVVEVRDLGPAPVGVRPDRVLPFVEVKPELQADEQYGSYTDEITAEGVTRTWSVEQVPPPPVISDRQFFQALALQGVITEQEALDAVRTGAIPPTMQGFIDALPTEQQFGAKMLISGAVEFVRSHPLVVQIGGALGWTDAQVDDLWRTAAALA